MYVDSDIFVLRSLVPCIAVAAAALPVGGLAAVRDVPAFPDTFNMGMFFLRPSAMEFESLMCKLHGGKYSNCTPIEFAEPWMEQGLLNAVYAGNWTEIPPTCSMNLDFWTDERYRREQWRPNASQVRAIHFTMQKPWDWTCPLTAYAPMCYLFWHGGGMRFHALEPY